MKILFQSPSQVPSWNLALEEALFTGMPEDAAVCLLWQNQPSVILGQYQNPAEEVNLDYAKAYRLPIVRRLSGGGAVYHDLGGLNFTFILPQKNAPHFEEHFCQPVLQTCQHFGISAQVSGRNDLTVNGRKFSGTASYERDGKVLFHGCILIASDLTAMAQVLTPPADKFQSKAISSVSSRVVNLQACCPGLTPAAFSRVLQKQLPYAACETLPASILQQADFLQKSRYATWRWNFGDSPLYAVTKRRRFPGCGALTAELEVVGGTIAAIRFSGDFFSRRPPAELADRLVGCSLQRSALAQTLSSLCLSDYFRQIQTSDFLDWLAL